MGLLFWKNVLLIIYHRPNLLVGLEKIGLKMVKLCFAPYLGGFVRVYMGFRLLWDTAGL